MPWRPRRWPRASPRSSGVWCERADPHELPADGHAADARRAAAPAPRGQRHRAGRPDHPQRARRRRAHRRGAGPRRGRRRGAHRRGHPGRTVRCADDHRRRRPVPRAELHRHPHPHRVHDAHAGRAGPADRPARHHDAARRPELHRQRPRPGRDRPRRHHRHAVADPPADLAGGAAPARHGARRRRRARGRGAATDRPAQRGVARRGQPVQPQRVVGAQAARRACRRQADHRAHRAPAPTSRCGPTWPAGSATTTTRSPPTRCSNGCASGRRSR